MSKTKTPLVVEALAREVRTATAGAARPRPEGNRLPTHGCGGLLPGVDLENKELVDRLLNEP